MVESRSTFGELILRAKSGDKDAFAEIYESHLTPVYRYVFIRLGNREEADDVTQETFLKAYQAIDRYEIEGGSFLPYLFTVARNIIINRSKKKREISMENNDIDKEVDGVRTSAYAENLELQGTLRDAMQTLSEGEREVVELRFFAEQSYTEIAAILEKREDAIRQQVARALKKMRIHMSQFV